MRRPLLLLAGALLVLGAAHADETAPPPAPAPSAGEMAIDALLLRPLGVVRTVLGAGLFVVALPFTLPAGDANRAADTLVGEPARSTFTRPLGDIYPPTEPPSMPPR